MNNNIVFVTATLSIKNPWFIYNEIPEINKKENIKKFFQKIFNNK